MDYGYIIFSLVGLVSFLNIFLSSICLLHTLKTCLFQLTLKFETELLLKDLNLVFADVKNENVLNYDNLKDKYKLEQVLTSG